MSISRRMFLASGAALAIAPLVPFPVLADPLMVGDPVLPLLVIHPETELYRYDVVRYALGFAMTEERISDNCFDRVLANG